MPRGAGGPPRRRRRRGGCSARRGRSCGAPRVPPTRRCRPRRAVPGRRPARPASCRPVRLRRSRLGSIRGHPPVRARFAPCWWSPSGRARRGGLGRRRYARCPPCRRVVRPDYCSNLPGLPRTKDDAGMQVTVRRATAADAPALARLRWRWPGEERDETGPDHAAFLEYFSAWVVDHLSTHLPFLAEVDGRVAGMAWLMLATRVPSPTRIDRRTGDVQSVYVVPELRNSGVGAALLDAVLAEARDRGLEHVTVHSSDRAVPFYLRAGFQDGQRWFHWNPDW